MNETVAVIIPVRNEEKYISKCIDSIIAQTYPRELIEIILIDGMSTDNTLSIIEKYIQEYREVKVFYNEKKITPISMNIGISNSKSDIVIILGAHSFIDKNFIKNNVRNLIDKKADASGGIVKFIHESFLSKCIGIATSCPFGVGNALYRYSKEEKYVDTVPFAAYKKSLLDKIGYFDEELVRNQDDELNFRVTESGGKILLSPDIISNYFSRSSLKKLWRQFYQYGYWKVRVIQKHNKPAALRHLIPVIFVLSMIFSLLIGIILKPALFIFFSIILSYGFVNIIFSTKLSVQNGLKCFAYLLLIFPILHISYGIGFLQGIIAFYLIKRRLK